MPHTTRQDKTQHHTKEKTTRQEQREERRVKREKIHFQCGGAWPFFVDGVLGFVHSVNARVLAC